MCESRRINAWPKKNERHNDEHSRQVRVTMAIRRSIEPIIRVSKDRHFSGGWFQRTTADNRERGTCSTKMNSVQKDFRVYRRLALWSTYRQSDVSLSHFDSVLLRPHIDNPSVFSGFLRFFDPLTRASARASESPFFSFYQPPPGPILSLAWNIPEDERKGSSH